jgi:hypothetical protein
MKNYLRVPILNDEYAVVVCWGTAGEVAKVLRRWHYPQEPELLEGCWEAWRGRCFQHPDRHPVIALPEPPTTPEQIATMAHEAIHAVDAIFDKIGAGWEGELFSHCVGAVVRHTLTYVAKLPKEEPCPSNP